MVRTGVFTGYAFDACSAPALTSIQAWSASPYRAVGIYIGGVNRACKQTNLTPAWVQTTIGLGWSLLPLYVGLQAPCASQSGLSKVSTNTTTAATQGGEAADDAANDATALGLPAGSPLWFDMEGYHLGDAACTKSVQSFAAWVEHRTACGRVRAGYLRQRRVDDQRCVERRGGTGPRVDRELERRAERLRRPVRQRQPVDEPPAHPPIQGRAPRDVRRRDDQHRQQRRRLDRRRQRRACAAASVARARRAGQFG